MYNTINPVDVSIIGNNEMLKLIFEGTKISKKKLTLGKLNPKMLVDMMQSQIHQIPDYTGIKFKIMDVEIEGEYNLWTITTKIQPA